MLFDREGNFYPIGFLSSKEIFEVETEVRRKVIKFFLKRGFLEKEEEQNIKLGEKCFSLDASVLIEAQDREGLERLIRYSARPVFASSRLEITGDGLKYILSKPNLKGEKVLFLKPFELLDRLAKLIPPPRYHQHFYHGVLASNHPLRAKIKALAGKAPRLARPGLQKVIGQVDQEGQVLSISPHVLASIGINEEENPAEFLLAGLS